MSRWNRPNCSTRGLVSAVFFGLAMLASPGWGPGEAAEPAEMIDSETVKQAAVEDHVTQGALRIEQPDGSLVECPLQHTDVTTEISGFIARVKLTQTFQNPTQETIEAVYVFPLPHEAAVDSMTMRMGERKVVGLIKRRDVARRVYERALAEGRTAALLEQERPNIFTQSVGNLEPGQEVKIEISYVDVLKYDIGSYEFHFPMVVGPRFIPGTPTGSPPPTPVELTGKVSPPISDTDRVSDATRISPPVLKPGFRNGHDIRLTVHCDAGVPIQALKVANHEAEVTRDGDRRASIQLSSADSIPNKDFVVRYEVMGARPEMAVLSHTGEYTDTGKLGEGYFMLMMQPREDERLKQMPPREVVFLVDTSGSMSGEPTAKVREAMQSMLELCRAKDTVQVITFASQAYKLFDAPVPVNESNIVKATNFSRNLRGAGGTRMLQGVQLAIDAPLDSQRLRIVVMLTDGYIGNEAEIIQHVGEHGGDQIRFWAIGIGSSPNMFLIDGVARQGGGMGKRLGLKDDTAALTQEVMHRIQRAQLSKIQIDWGGLEVSETYPAKIPELWAGRPVVLFGRYSRGGRADIQVSGRVEGESVSWPLAVELPSQQSQHDVLAKVWARKKIEDLMHQAFYQDAPAIEEEVTSIALDYGLISQYTSFVAVDEAEQAELTEPAQRPRQMLVPIPLPEGTRYEGFFGPPRSEVDLIADAGDRLTVLAGVRRSVVSRGQPNLPLPASRVPRKRSQLFYQPLSSSQLTARPFGETPRAAAQGWYFSQNTSHAVARGRVGQLPSRPSSGRGGRGGVRSKYGVGGGAGAGFGRANASVRGLSVGSPVRLLRESLASESVRSSMAGQESSYVAAALQSQAPAIAKAATAALAQATEFEKKNDLTAARAGYLRACFLDRAAANVGASPGTVGGKALVAIERLRAQDLEAWTEQLPGLAGKLDLILRDQSIAEALAKIAAAAGVPITLTPGCVEDAAALRLETPRVSFLNLRNASLAEALDWTLQPAGLTWRVVDGRLVATSARRLAEETAWVYDVSMAALPTQDELGDFKDRDKSLKTCQSVADQLLAAVRSDLGGDESSIVWFAPGQLLVLGDRQRHAQAAQQLATWTDPRQEPAGKLRPIYAAAQNRAKARAAAVAKQLRLSRQWQVVAAHEAMGWQLLAAAAGGQLDLEALTELQIAWKRQETDDLLEGSGATAMLKSNWIVNEAARTLPAALELQTLANLARDKSRTAADVALAAARKNSEDVPGFTGTLYAALASSTDESYRANALPLLTPARGDQSPLAQASVLAAALLGDHAKIDRAALEQVIANGLGSDEMVALTALAACRTGGEVWQTYRATSHASLAQQPLAGSVVVLVNRLARGQLAVLATR